MKAARIIEPTKIEVVEAKKPEAEAGQILVQTTTAALCGSDMPFFLREQPMAYPFEPGFPGHECIGVVAQTRCEEYAEGDRVLALPARRRGFAEYFISTPASTVKLPAGDIGDKLVLAQPLGTIIHACRKLFQPLLHPPRGGDEPLDVGSWKLPGVNVAIIGQGSIGLLFTAMMKLMEADSIIGVDLLDYRLDIAMKMGTTQVINASNSNSAEMMSEITGGAMANLVIEAVGKESTINDCFTLARRGGTVLAFGIPEKSVYKIGFTRFFRAQLKLLTSEGPEVQVEFPPALELVASGGIDVSQIISHRMSLDDVQEAFDMTVERKDGVVKILLGF